MKIRLTIPDIAVYKLEIIGKQADIERCNWAGMSININAIPNLNLRQIQERLQARDYEVVETDDITKGELYGSALGMVAGGSAAGFLATKIANSLELHTNGELKASLAGVIAYCSLAVPSILAGGLIGAYLAKKVSEWWSRPTAAKEAPLH